MSEEKRSASRKSQPISRHPLFPAIVALWSGALFGLASLALRPAVIEHLVLALGIDKAIPMAAPPLGTTARILMTLGLTGLGVVIGVLAALRIARPAPENVARSAARPAAKTRTPGRRRSFAPGNHDGARNLQDDTSARTQILNVADFEVDSFDAEDAASTSAPAEVVEASYVEVEAEAGPEYDTPLFLQPRAGEAAPISEAEDDGAPQIGASSLTTDAGEQASESDAREPVTFAAPPFSAPGHAAADRIASAALDDLSPIELLERLALAMAQRRDETRLGAAPAAPIADDEPPVEIEPPLIETSTQANLVDLETVEEPEALGEEPAMHAPLQPRFDPEPVQEAAIAPELPRLPAALRPVNLAPIEDEDGDDALPAYIPPRHIGLTPAAMIDDDEGGDAEGEEEEVLERGYSSLTSLSHAAWSPPTEEVSAEFNEDTEIAEPSARPFDAPGHPAAHTDPETAEKALRDALATLQRMSGAA